MTPVAGRGGGAAPRSVDVARLAGVSQKTVSRVMNDEPYVSEDVRRRVLAAAGELGYRSNNAARALASGRTRSIGVVTLGTALYGPASLLMGVERAVRDTGYALRVVNTMEGEAAGIAGAVDSLLDQGVDGIVISEPIDEEGGGGAVGAGRRAGPRARRASAVRRVACRDGWDRLRADGAGGDRASAGTGARDGSSSGRAAAVVLGAGPS